MQLFKKIIKFDLRAIKSQPSLALYIQV